MTTLQNYINTANYTLQGYTYSEMKQWKYNDARFKMIQKEIHVSLKKKQLLKSFLENIRSLASVRIYNSIMRWWFRHQIQEKGICWVHRSLSENMEDPISLDDIHTIPAYYFLTVFHKYRWYVLDIRHYLYYEKNHFKNPFTNEMFSSKTIHRIRKRYCKLSQWDLFINVPPNHTLPENLCVTRALTFRCITLIQTMDQLGYYSNVDWIMSLNVTDLKKWYMETEDIWNYRAQLTLEQKFHINPQLNNFEIHVNIVKKQKDIQKLRQLVLDEIEKLICRGTRESDRCLGCIYILMGLATINPFISESYPWLETVIL